jgi:hypothetical protein
MEVFNHTYMELTRQNIIRLRLVRMCLVLGCSLKEFEQRFPLVYNFSMSGEYTPHVTTNRETLIQLCDDDNVALNDRLQ